MAIDSHLESNNLSFKQINSPLQAQDDTIREMTEQTKRNNGPSEMPTHLQDLNSQSMETESRVLLDDKQTPRVETDTSVDEEGVTKVAKHQFGSRFNYYQNFYPYEYQVQIKKKLESNQT
mmetsp:Transcript_13168/g.20481  ORF Transcript_13168/g.20481 Transcript_13168/m.20481 type:complete len:120 (-) Transcript_13168:4814-5173(-)